MFGYATDETEECMPLTVVLAHRLNQKIAELRRSGDFWWARPDSKTQVCLIKCNMYNEFYVFLNWQVTCEYRFDHGACIPQRVHTVVVSLQHSEKISLNDLRSEILNKVIKEVIPQRYLTEDTIVHINPCGLFIIGGPQVRTYTFFLIYRLFNNRLLWCSYVFATLDGQWCKQKSERTLTIHHHCVHRNAVLSWLHHLFCRVTQGWLAER